MTTGIENLRTAIFCHHKSHIGQHLWRHCWLLLPIPMDVPKVFDRVWHDGLFHKLKYCGISSQIIGLISFFLSNRWLQVIGKYSDQNPCFHPKFRNLYFFPVFLLLLLRKICNHHHQHHHFHLSFCWV